MLKNNESFLLLQLHIFHQISSDLFIRINFFTLVDLTSIIFILLQQLNIKQILQQMDTQLILTILIPFLALMIYYIYVKPVKVMNHYTKLLKRMGYKVLQETYNPFKNDIFDTINRGVREGDAMKIFKFQRGPYDVIVTNSMLNPKLQFNHPDFIKDFYSVDKHYDYPKQPKVVSLITRASGRKHLTSAEGHQWKRKRTIFNKLFNFDFIRSKANKIAELAQKSILQEQRLGQKFTSEQAVSYNIFQLTTRIFSEVMMEIFLGGNNNQLIGGKPAGLFLTRLLEDSIGQAMRPLNYLLGRKFLDSGLTKEQRQINARLIAYKAWSLQYVTKRINEINQNYQNIKDKIIPTDIIEGLIVSNRKAQTLNSGEESIDSPEQIVDDFTSFFIAGIQTTATFTQMMIYYLAIYPNVEEKVRKQISEFMKNEDYSFENLRNFKYIDYLQKQTTRYFGPATTIFPRIAKVDNYLSNLPIKKGTEVIVMHVGNHFSQKYFKDPLEFRPQRWQNQCGQIPPFVCGGFSAGARACIGKHLALMDSKITLIKFLKRYKKITLQKNDIKIGFSFAVNPEQVGVKMFLDSDNGQNL